ncbi:hypothetical protein ISF_08819 [Cordyceps fumosorosea ARSEF 2679]|uniref:Uncharacterized protein n=1 Tax=Cordyceps fumosorosea (strain ARSEF 2679) TaxID=1081104 RepID=A0A162K4T1_CORFA|nr:hypothetical protein ISF_08819 [Cordyceps fumosorosea ARSEF 2679]OAA53338.1 hypothetical protein ISF_08819 [Cordyceps fumosorosea ARSEF 2679]
MHAAWNKWRSPLSTATTEPSPTASPSSGKTRIFKVFSDGHELAVHLAARDDLIPVPPPTRVTYSFSGHQECKAFALIVVRGPPYGETHADGRGTYLAMALAADMERRL